MFSFLTINTLLAALDIAGTAVFAVSGAGLGVRTGPAGGLSSNHIRRLGQLQAEMRRALEETLGDTESLRTLPQQVNQALKSADEIAELRRQMDGVIKELNLQFQRIAQKQMQIDRLMTILASSAKTTG